MDVSDDDVMHQGVAYFMVLYTAILPLSVNCAMMLAGFISRKRAGIASRLYESECDFFHAFFHKFIKMKYSKFFSLILFPRLQESQILQNSYKNSCKIL